jgi:hypothetical protein
MHTKSLIMVEALRRLFIVSESLNRILKKDKPKADIVEGMTKAFFKKTNADEAVITIKENKMSRTGHQNNLYWHIIEQVRVETDNSKDAIHVHCQTEFLKTRIEEVAGLPRLVLKSTTSLNTKEMGIYLDKVIAWCGNDLGMNLNLPDGWRKLVD